MVETTIPGRIESILDLLILGCGYTGQRVARRFLARGADVTVTTRDPQGLAHLGARVIALSDLPAYVRPGVLVLYSIPPGGPPKLLELLGNAPARMVYLSTTAVYGAAGLVGENTPVDLSTEKARARVEEEQRVAEGHWSSLILRPAAIYGPGRGVHENLKRGIPSIRSQNFVSRIHVKDLATHVEAALQSTLTGPYPVADEEPCTSRQMAEFCEQLLNIAASAAGSPESGRAARVTTNRRVDGSPVRRALGITLAYPSYRVGVPAALAEF